MKISTKNSYNNDKPGYKIWTIVTVYTYVQKNFKDPIFRLKNSIILYCKVEIQIWLKGLEATLASKINPMNFSA